MLNEKQLLAAYNIRGNTIVCASPGTGKTKTLVARAQRKLESMPKYKSLALITYTNAAADEISSRMGSDDKLFFIGTIHRFCLEFILRPFGWLYNWNRPRIITYDELNEFILINEDVDFGDNPLDELNKFKRLLDGSLDMNHAWADIESFEYVAELYFAFLDSNNALDFNDILYRSYKIICENAFVAKSLANKFYEISIDEFQDTNIFQYEILRCINAWSSCTFFMVGDEKQKIYKFAGAIDNAFDNAQRDFESEIVTLDISYRSTSNIIRGYSSLFSNHPPIINESIYKNLNSNINLREVNNNADEIYILGCINNIIENHKIQPSEIALLTTNWRNAYNLSRTLRTTYNIVGLGALPHRSVNSSTFALIRCLSKYRLSPSIKNLRSTRRNIEFHTLENGANLTDNELTKVLNSLITRILNFNLNISLLDGLISLKDIFELVFEFSHSDIVEIVNIIDVQESHDWTLEKYFKTLAGIDGITINTIHQAKGLEYECVLLYRINENRLLTCPEISLQQNC